MVSYENLEKTRAKRVAKEKITEGKGKCVPKRKSPAPEAGAPELKTKEARMSEVPEPWKAPMERMY